MLVSNFELLVKRIAPLAPPGPSNPVNAPFRRVVQGYFLIVTNLDPARTANFALRITIPALPDGSPDAFDREFVLGEAPNVRTGFDIATSDNVPLALILSPSTPTPGVKTYFTRAFTIGPLQTASVNLLPNLGVGQVLLNEKLEIRGTVELVRSYFGREIFTGAPPIDVLVTPEIRGTFLDNNYTGATTSAALDFDQINYGLPVASGKGRNTVEGLSPIRLELPFPPVEFELLDGLQQDLVVNFNEQLSRLGLVIQPMEQETPVS